MANRDLEDAEEGFDRYWEYILQRQGDRITERGIEVSQEVTKSGRVMGRVPGQQNLADHLKGKLWYVDDLMPGGSERDWKKWQGR